MIEVVTGTDLRAGSRSGRGHYLRWAYAAWLVLQLVVYHLGYLDRCATLRQEGRSPLNETAGFARELTSIIVWQHFILLILLTPGFVAGAITDEKSRGTLQYIMTTHLRPFDLVGGKLLSRMVQVLALMLAAAPMLGLLGAFGGLTGVSLFVLFAVSLAMLVGLGGVSVLASVETKNTRGAVLWSYGVMIAVVVIAESESYFAPMLASLVGAPLGRAFTLATPFSPFYVLDATFGEAGTAGDWPARLLLVCGTWLTTGLLAFTVAVLRLRPVYIRQLEARPASARMLRLAFLPRPPVGDRPLVWKETYVGHWVPVELAALGVALISGVGQYFLLQQAGASVGFRESLFMSMAFYGATGLTLLVGVRTSSTITHEREKNTWGELLTTPLTAEELIKGKLAGIVASLWPLYTAHLAAGAAAYAIATDGSLGIAPVVGMARFSPGIALVLGLAGWLGGRWLLSLGASAWLAGCIWPIAASLQGSPVLVMLNLVALAAGWLFAYFIGAVGIWSSARASSTWRAMVQTLFVGYLGATVLSCVSAPLWCVSMCIIGVIGALLEEVGKNIGMRTGDLAGVLASLSYIAITVGVYYVVSLWAIALAQRQIATKDRIPVGRIRGPRIPWSRRDDGTPPALRRRRPS